MELPNFGEEGQAKLSEAKILVIGAGGLGAPVCSYLAAAGVGTIGVIDGDLVEKRNLHRQVIHPEGHIGIRKARSAKNIMLALNSEIKVNAITKFYTEENALEVTEEYDLVVDCSDNFETRYLTNAICRELGIPWVYGAVYEFEGQVSVFNLGEDSPCYECLLPSYAERPVRTSKAILGMVPAVVGSIQAMEAIKIITGIAPSLSGTLLVMNLLNHTYQKVPIKKRIGCVCTPYID
jgi:adenylyltransferase/sulfurtransferase